MKSIIREVFTKYFTFFGIPENVYHFDLNDDELKHLLGSKSYNDPVILAYIKGCRVDPNYRTTAFDSKQQMTLVGIGEYQIKLDIIGFYDESISKLEGMICACTNLFFSFEGYRECRIQVENISYDDVLDYSGKLPLLKTSIGCKMVFPLFRREKLNLINIQDINIYVRSRR
ncbi:hypothetical protein F0310_04555 (plasmid) [Borrelia sp. A-FGy1]|uniref:hypothetical protein n=1 Tax=Borrelia sp. A-FGy1 TaxID=2608247 RepID=UPI0015F507F7|nr:hypothetical protein [Borrelia sp. A-FGy1]QMU99689.1 hypothetical protein F0310_04555 [Borrelia sp. A-FGy1]